MLFLFSPSKTMDFQSPLTIEPHTLPVFSKEANQLIKICQRLTIEDIQTLMGVSRKIAELNFQRFQDWDCSDSPHKARQAIAAFAGEAYESLDTGNLSTIDMDYAQKHLRILSGLYGILRPMDLIQPHRLDMGTRLPNGNTMNLYQFWKTTLTEYLQQELSHSSVPIIVNLASQEYSKAVDIKKLNAKIIEPIFLDQKNGKSKVISFYAKRARGLMCRYAIRHQISQSAALQNFNLEGYCFDDNRSDDSHWYYVRHTENQL
ncbi:peroxide stress protein YaaA [Bombiscardovia coagulans]|uniref:UPF0246 protein BOCO_0508 n=1 Tax=Bombiscardovia coagulans TaxID=686666 RepID=A0A261ET09_9BIFI|nr:peroxide stress protein YaaA [Bombiscardovia coagulans]OZG49991.1 hypothetical protein BOCO_0508 [Bombiscardovia coagulans]